MHSPQYGHASGCLLVPIATINQPLLLTARRQLFVRFSAPDDGLRQSSHHMVHSDQLPLDRSREAVQHVG